MKQASLGHLAQPGNDGPLLRMEMLESIHDTPSRDAARANGWL
jgi:hypothetical protein